MKKDIAPTTITMDKVKHDDLKLEVDKMISFMKDNSMSFMSLDRLPSLMRNYFMDIDYRSTLIGNVEAMEIMKQHAKRDAENKYSECIEKLEKAEEDIEILEVRLRAAIKTSDIHQKYNTKLHEKIEEKDKEIDLAVAKCNAKSSFNFLKFW